MKKDTIVFDGNYHSAIDDCRLTFTVDTGHFKPEDPVITLEINFNVEERDCLIFTLDEIRALTKALEQKTIELLANHKKGI